MAGGKGKRFGDKEKQLVKLNGKRLIDRVIGAFDSSKITDYYIAVSDNSPRTKNYCKKKYESKIINTEGISYHHDLNKIIETLGKPLVTTSSDIPFLKGKDINLLLEKYKKNSLSLAVPKDSSNGENSKIEFVGVNIIGEKEKNEIVKLKEPRLRFNINTKKDLQASKNFIEKYINKT